MGSDEDIELKDVKEIEELSGKLKHEDAEDKLMHSVLENDSEAVNDGKLLNEIMNQGMSTFIPDMMFEQMVKNYAMAEQIFGEKMIRLISGYDPNYIKRNIKIPEFARELKQKLAEGSKQLKKKGLLDKEGMISDFGIKLASLVLYTDELDKMISKGLFGEKIHKKSYVYGDKGDDREYRKGDRYRDFAIKKAVKTAIRRGHTQLETGDFRTYNRRSKGSVNIIYALDASGSMKGDKIETAKKAGIALAFKAINSRDKVGLVVFGDEVKEEVAPCLDFPLLIDMITRVRASSETNFTEMIKRAVVMFERGDMTKHLILITDALPTVGKEPMNETLEAVSLARSLGVTISVVGIQLDSEGGRFAEKMARLGEGRLHIVKNVKDMDKIVLEDYYSVV